MPPLLGCCIHCAPKVQTQRCKGLSFTSFFFIVGALLGTCCNTTIPLEELVKAYNGMVVDESLIDVNAWYRCNALVMHTSFSKREQKVAPLLTSPCFSQLNPAHNALLRSITTRVRGQQKW